ncbi:MAG: universal stress protein [Gammaproteobacteria bacterium]|nr:universal stress protein [Gammaproteobacteria bacterium]NIM74138.1 universal stress protein [Gammaproteobacteria bacterium]NIN39021.1 universal stress protein [Gammaproteobacteria bacterium]NIO25914.1 universal stress protein [Gammaproteobacteria bacterium]NIO66545.1 universal stress protein [Gammaproteobacteria bacterium]
MKTILVPFYDDDIAQNALGASWLVAEKFSSYVEALFVMRPPQIFDGEGIALAGSYMTQLKDEERRLAESAHKRFQSVIESRGITLAEVSTPSQGVTAGWRETEGLEGQVVGDYGRLFDLIVIGRNFGQPWIDWSVMCEAALFETGRPVLVVGAQAPSSIGERIVVAWNGSTETARCIALSMPFLARAQSVVVLTVEGWQVPGPSGDQVTAHLQRNGIKAISNVVEAGGRSVGEAILDETKALDADLIVKGAYTHSRLRQLVFGGATRHLLGNTPIPLFMAH